MKAAFQAGNALLEKSQGSMASLVFKNYVKNGDQVTLSFDTPAKKLRNYDVKTYLDVPEDAATMSARFDSLADGTHYMSDTLLNATAKQIQIKITNFAHKKVGDHFYR